MKDLDPALDVRAAAAALDSSLVRRLADGGSMAVRVYAPENVHFHPACAAAAAFANLSELLTLLPHAGGAICLPFSALQALGARAIAAAAQTAGLQAEAITLELDETGLSEAGAAGLSLAEALKARGFRLQLNCAKDAPFGLDQRARSLFASAQTPAAAAIAAMSGPADMWSDPMARRIVSTKAAGMVLLACDADETQKEDLRALGFAGASFAEAA